MSDRTAIEWAANADGTPGATWNPIRARNRETGKVGWFCVHASDGCKFCYAETFNARLGTGVDYKAQNADQVEVFLDDKMLLQPLRWRKPRTIFVGSMTDLFGEFVRDEMIDRVCAVMALCPEHTFIVLTKRSARMREYFADRQARANAIGAQVMDLSDSVLLRHALPLPNVWLGVSVEDQANADRRIPDLLQTPAAVRFISAEPLLGPIDLTNVAPPSNGYGGRAHGIDALSPHNRLLRGVLDWVIVGGESGRAARPMHPDWARALRDQCADAGVAFFFKQWGEWAPVDYRSDDGSRRFVNMGDRKEPIVLRNPNERDTAARVAGAVNVKRVGKKAAGRLLDGVEHNERPQLMQELFS